MKAGLALDCQIGRVHQVGPQELLLPRPAQELPDQPVRPAAVRRRRHRGAAGRRLRRRASASAGPTWKRTPARTSTTAGGFSQVDLNRAGTPLLEIVTEPDLNSRRGGAGLRPSSCSGWCATSASAEANMQMGHMRFEPNINLHIERGGPGVQDAHRRGQEPQQLPGPGAERRLRDPAAARRLAGNRPDACRWATRHARLGRCRTRPTVFQREKEEAHDYRYFPDPDLVPVVTTRAVAGRDSVPAVRVAFAEAGPLRADVWPERVRRGRPDGGPRDGRFLRAGSGCGRRSEADLQPSHAGRPEAGQRAGPRFAGPGTGAERRRDAWPA